MVIFFSGNAAGGAKDKGCDPEVALGDDANVMLTYSNILTGMMGQDDRFSFMKGKRQRGNRDQSRGISAGT